jgi:hypothetical protein
MSIPQMPTERYAAPEVSDKEYSTSGNFLFVIEFVCVLPEKQRGDR